MASYKVSRRAAAHACHPHPTPVVG